MKAINTSFNLIFWLHLLLLLLSLAGPFLFSWYVICAAYIGVLLQFAFLNRCVMNIEHGLDDGGNHTFYALLLEMMGFRFDRGKVRKFVRFWLYIVLASVTFVWQIYLGFEPLIFF